MDLRINHSKRYLRLMGFSLPLLFFAAFSCRSSYPEQEPITCIDEYRQLRDEKLNRHRLIYNNDGNDASFFPVKVRKFIPGTEYQVQPPRDSVEVEYKFSIESFINSPNRNMAGLTGTDVTTISYCTSSGGFSQYTHATKVGQFMSHDIKRPGFRNVSPEFLKLGTDPLEVAGKFAREKGFEFFWSNRINDTHDAAHRLNNPFPRWTNLKEKNPHFLMGSIEERVPARWSSVDFKHQEIRDLCLEYYTEVCKNYDVDGIELDFFRHLFLFGNVARHEGVATNEQLGMITDMVARIREMTERVGMKKGNPILVLVRVPDSFEYCEGVGIALREWAERGLIDIVIGSGYFRLNPWKYMVNALQNHNVKFYASFDESRIRDGHPHLVRNQNAVFRARAAAAWQAGVEGIFLFNQFNTRARYFSQIGEAEKLKSTNNLYFVNYRGTPGGSLSNPDFYLKNGSQHLNLPQVNPLHPVVLGSGSKNFALEIGNESDPSDVFVILYADGVNGEDLDITVNEVKGSYKNSTVDGLLIFNISHSAINPGKNDLVVNNKTRGSDDQRLLDAAILFLRDTEDPELGELIGLCMTD